MKFDKIIYIGIVSDEVTELVGGFAVANERNIAEYKKRGYEVEVLQFPTMQKKTPKNVFVYLQELIQFTSKAKKVARTYRGNKNILVHITPHYDLHLISFCYKAIQYFSRNKVPVLIDIRAGAFIWKFKKYGSIYRDRMTRFLKRANYITVEGEKYISFVKELTDETIPVHYYPNYVKDEQILQHSRKVSHSGVQLIYFGRITKEKGISLLIDLHRLLKENHRVKTVIIGSGEKDYIAELKKKIAEDQLNIDVYPPQSKAFINEELLKSNFFIFPTFHDGEGHSNALSEAMAYGVVPLVSDNGFNKAVVKDVGKVFDINAKAESYAEAVDEIVVNGKWQKFSEAARLKILNKFSNKNVSDNFFKFITST